MKKQKVLFDTSCVYAVLNHNLEPSLAKQLPAQSKKCIYYTSLYLRMEFFRRWIITGIEIYSDARIRGNIEETFQWFSHKFKPREVKNVLQWATRYINSISAEPPTEPIERFGWEVLSLALVYDEIFRHFTQVKTGCSRGRLAIDFDNPTRRKTLNDFYERFTSTDHTCKLETLLNVPRECPRLVAIRKASAETLTPEYRKGFTRLQTELEKLIDRHQTPTCDNCYKIGDILIALEQPPKTVLYHVDYSFSAICPLLKHEHKQLKSVLKTGSSHSYLGSCKSS